jgi:hypothetical protein
VSLKLKTKSVRFEFMDDDVESVVTLSSDDDQDILVRKLKRIIALVEGEQGAPPPKVAPLPQGVSDALEKAYDAPPVTNGWAAPVPPARWAGEVELIQPGEDA